MQTAFTALCYFCENHGPRIVFTCQPITNSQLNLGNQTETDNLAGETSPAENGDETSANLSFAPEDAPKFHDFYGGQEIVDDEARCAACSSFEHGMGMISEDLLSEISFVSTQVPINERLNQILKQASLRSLSVEVSAPAFTEQQQEQQPNSLATNSSANQQTFQNGGAFTNDTERDGVVLFGDHENWYTLSYTFRVKDAKARGFHRSYSLLVISTDKLLLLRNYDFLVQGLFAIVTKLQEMTNEFFSFEQEKDRDLRIASNVKASSHWLPHQFYPKQYTVDTSRSLRQITNDEEIFTLLHRQMLGLLKTMASLDKDIVLEGCPTQDMMIIMEMSKSGSLEEKELIAFLSPKQSLAQVANLRLIAGQLAAVDPALLNALVWQVVIGEQVVVKCSSLTARRLFLLSLVQLLPIGCIRLVTNSQQYLHSYKCNFFGCQPPTKIPEDIQPDIFLVNLSRHTDNGDSPQVDGCSFDKISLRDFRIEVENCPKREEAEKPAIVSRYIQLLLDPLLNDFTLESALRATRNDWQNSAKLIFQLRHQREAIDLDKIMRVIKYKPQDSPVILFWQKGLSKRYKQVVLNTTATSNSARRQEGQPTAGQMN